MPSSPRSPTRRPGPREVVVEVAACGLCGTDLHILQGEFAPTLPIVPGHEFAGRGGRASAREVTELAVGDRVAVDPSLYCYECRYCRTGHNNLCERWAAIGVTDGGRRGRSTRWRPVANCVKLPEHVRTAGRGADRAAVLRGARLRRAAQPASAPTS